FSGAPASSRNNCPPGRGERWRVSTPHLGDSMHDLLDGRLSAPQAALARRHLETCQECAERFRELADARVLINTSEAGIDINFAQKLMNQERMRELSQAETSRINRAVSRPRRHYTVVLGSVAFVAAFLLSTAWFLGEPKTVDY